MSMIYKWLELKRNYFFEMNSWKNFRTELAIEFNRAISFEIKVPLTMKYKEVP